MQPTNLTSQQTIPTDPGTSKNENALWHSSPKPPHPYSQPHRLPRHSLQELRPRNQMPSSGGTSTPPLLYPNLETPPQYRRQNARHEARSLSLNLSLTMKHQEWCRSKKRREPWECPCNGCSGSSFCGTRLRPPWAAPPSTPSCRTPCTSAASPKTPSLSNETKWTLPHCLSHTLSLSLSVSSLALRERVCVSVCVCVWVFRASRCEIELSACLPACLGAIATGRPHWATFCSDDTIPP